MYYLSTAFLNICYLKSWDLIDKYRYEQAQVIWSHLKSFEVIQYHYSRSWILDEKWVKNELEMFKKDCKMIKNEWIWLKTIENMSILVKLLEMTSFEQVSNGDESDKHL